VATELGSVEEAQAAADARVDVLVAQRRKPAVTSVGHSSQCRQGQRVNFPWNPPPSCWTFAVIVSASWRCSMPPPEVELVAGVRREPGVEREPSLDYNPVGAYGTSIGHSAACRVGGGDQAALDEHLHPL
jgi:hypothetical protein